MAYKTVAILAVLFTLVACAGSGKTAMPHVADHGSVAVDEKANHPAYFVFNYQITHPEAYATYLAQVPATLSAYDGEVVIADFTSESIEGEAGDVTVVLKFDSVKAARDWYDSPEYQRIISLRMNHSDGIAALAFDEN